MSYLDTLQKRRVSPRAAEHALRISIGSKKYRAYLVVEGEEDEEYYSYAFENLHPEIPFQVVVCDGKGGVLGLRDFVDEEYSNVKEISFFIDRDHDDFVGINASRDDTYVTDGYSIEWEVVSSNILIEVFKENFGVSQSDEILQKFEDFVVESMKVLIPRYRTIMCMAIALRKMDYEPNFDKLGIKSLFYLENKKYRKKKISFSDITIAMECPHDLSFACILKELEESKDKQDKLVIRGKTMISICCDLLNEMASDPLSVKQNGRKIKAKIQIGKKNFLHIAYRHSNIPKSLEGFLTRAGIAADGAENYRHLMQRPVARSM